MFSLVEGCPNSLTVPATVKHNGVTVETQQLCYRGAQGNLQRDAAGSPTDDATLQTLARPANRLVSGSGRFPPFSAELPDEAESLQALTMTFLKPATGLAGIAR